MDSIKILGLIAGTLTTVAFVPQVMQTYRTRSAKDLSLGMFLIFFTGTCCWLSYGLIRNDLPVILANAVTAALSVVLLYFKIKFRS